MLDLSQEVDSTELSKKLQCDGSNRSHFWKLRNKQLLRKQSAVNEYRFFFQVA